MRSAEIGKRLFIVHVVADPNDNFSDDEGDKKSNVVYSRVTKLPLDEPNSVEDGEDPANQATNPDLA